MNEDELRDFLNSEDPIVKKIDEDLYLVAGQLMNKAAYEEWCKLWSDETDSTTTVL